MIRKIMNIPSVVVLLGIRVYQSTLSPDSGIFSALFPFGFCKYHPTCSEYTHQAISRYGLGRGLVKGMGRVVRCNPFSKGGFDSVS